MYFSTLHVQSPILLTLVRKRVLKIGLSTRRMKKYGSLGRKLSHEPKISFPNMYRTVFLMYYITDLMNFNAYY